jgi:hypothetical protein
VLSCLSATSGWRCGTTRADTPSFSRHVRPEGSQGHQRLGDRAIRSRILGWNDQVVGHPPESKPACSAATATPASRSPSSVASQFGRIIPTCRTATSGRFAERPEMRCHSGQPNCQRMHPP